MGDSVGNEVERPDISCGGCAYFLRHPRLPGQGDCRRRAPSPRIQTSEFAGEPIAVWPSVDIHFGWCGEFVEARVGFPAS